MAQLHGGKWKVGDIRLWFKKEIPRNWVLCDGENGTPKTTGRVVIGAGFGAKTYGEIPALGDQLGNTFLTPTGKVEGHTLSNNEGPAHSHKYVVRTGSGGSSANTISAYAKSNPRTQSGNILSSGGSKAHAHGLTLDSIDVRQKGVGVYYIMKIR